MLGASQPNLSTLTDEIDSQVSEEVSQSSEQLLFERTNSNPNLIDSNDSEEDSINENVSQIYPFICKTDKTFHNLSIKMQELCILLNNFLIQFVD